MINDDLKNRLEESLHACKKHLERMSFAKEQLSDHLPLTTSDYELLTATQISYIDQYLFRFSKLQDTLGTRVFTGLLELWAEPLDQMAFIDALNRLEQLGILESKNDWLSMRKMRNDASHEYPQTITDRIEGINQLFNRHNAISDIFKNCENAITERTKKNG